MIRLLFRILGLVVLAGGFAQFVVDGTRSIAGGALTWTALSGLIESAAPGRIATCGPKVAANLHPLLWDPLATTLLAAPACVVLAVLGVVLLVAGRRKVVASPGFDLR